MHHPARGEQRLVPRSRSCGYRPEARPVKPWARRRSARAALLLPALPSGGVLTAWWGWRGVRPCVGGPPPPPGGPPAPRCGRLLPPRPARQRAPRVALVQPADPDDHEDSRREQAEHAERADLL